MKPCIYVLRDPRDGCIRYAGYAKNFQRRMYWHLNDYGKHKNGKQCTTEPWILELVELGLMPIAEVVQWLEPGDDWETCERFWIASLRKDGEPLLNKNPGGLGGVWQHTPAMVAKMRNTLRERWMQLSELERKNELEKLRHMLTARWADPEQRHILSEKATLRWRRWRAEHGYTETWNKRRLVRPEERKQQTQEFRDSQAEKTRQVWAAMSKEERAAFVAKLAQARARARRRVA